MMQSAEPRDNQFGEKALTKWVLVTGGVLATVALISRATFQPPSEPIPEPEPEPTPLLEPSGTSPNEGWFGQILKALEKPPEPVEPGDGRRDAVPQKTQILIPRNEAQTNCTINGGGLGCFETDYLPCVEFGAGGCLKRESPERSPSPVADAQPASDRRWCRRVFNGICWEQ